MSITSATSPTTPFDTRDIRSASVPFKRDKDHGSKWSNGLRPGAGVTLSYNSEDFGADVLHGGSDSQKARVRPRKTVSQSYSDPKPRANKTPKPNPSGNYHTGRQSGRISNKMDAHFDSQEHTTLSNSLLDLLPVNNPSPPSQHSPIILATQNSTASVDDPILYNFDNKGPSPGVRGTNVELEGLVELAEKKWVAEQTEKIVRGEYEVLDLNGEEIKRRGKKSPKQKAARSEVIIKANEDDDGFELV